MAGYVRKGVILVAILELPADDSRLFENLAYLFFDGTFHR